MLPSWQRPDFNAIKPRYTVGLGPERDLAMQKTGESQYRPTELTSVFWHLSGSPRPVVHWTSLAIFLSASTAAQSAPAEFFLRRAFRSI
jgi:hypothetical protein